LRFLRKREVQADYLVIPGDISHKAQPQEFQLASSLVKDVAKTLGTQRKAIIFVPGNHDVDWKELEIPDSTGFRQSQRYAPLRHHDWVFSRIIGSRAPHFYEPPHFCVWEFDDLLAVGYNSAWYDDPNVSVHHGLIAGDHIHELDSHLARLDLSKQRLRLFLVH